MALPIWGIFMKKVFDNGTLGVSKNDVFTAPQGFDLNLNCSGGDEDMKQQSTDDLFMDF